MGITDSVPEWQVWVALFTVLTIFSALVGSAVYRWERRRTGRR